MSTKSSPAHKTPVKQESAKIINNPVTQEASKPCTEKCHEPAISGQPKNIELGVPVKIERPVEPETPGSPGCGKRGSTTFWERFDLDTKVRIASTPRPTPCETEKIDNTLKNINPQNIPPQVKDAVMFKDATGTGMVCIGLGAIPNASLIANSLCKEISAKGYVPTYKDVTNKIATSHLVTFPVTVKKAT